MAYSNGQPKAANGSTYGNGSINGKMNGSNKTNGKPLTRRSVPRKQRGFFASVFGMVARLATWAAILTVLFRCPDSLEACDESSPFICRSYFQAKNIVVPHAKPYYDHYAAPYVEVAKPYYETVDKSVFTPTRKYAVQYGGPWAQKAQDYALGQWKVTGEPKLTQLREASQTQYQQSVEPLLQQANAAVGPYYEIARTNGLQAYYDYLVPGYAYAQPYLRQGYQSTADFATNSALPAAHWTWQKTYLFLDTAVWPQIRALYLEHVDPQLVRIGERLGRYKTTAKHSTLKDAITEAVTSTETIVSSFNKPSSQSESQTSSQETKTTESSEPVETVEIQSFDEEMYDNPVKAPPPAANESEKRRKAREMVAHDLALWQNKYAAAADQGAADMEERVSEISQEKISNDVQGTGQSLATALTTTVQEQISILKDKISAIVSNAELAGSAAEDEVTVAVRAAGVAIKDKAQKLRAWRETFDKDLQDTVIQAADVHFRILDETRSLALQEIGMRWAWTEGVTYKDWAKYHELKATLNNWTEQLKQLIVSNPALLDAQDAAAQVEDHAMEVAGSAAKDLVRLKEVAHYKIIANDATDNFEAEAMQLAAEAALAAKQAQRAAEESAKEAASKAAEAATDAASAASSNAADLAEEASSALGEASVVGEQVEEKSTAASQSVSSILSEGEDATSQVGEEISSTATAISSEVEGVTEQASSFVSEASESVAESVASVIDAVSEKAEEYSEAASASVHKVVNDAEDSVSEAASDVSESASSLWDDAESVASEAATEASENFDEDKSEAEAAATALASDASEAIVGQTQSIVSNLTEEPSSDSEDDLPIEVVEDPLAEREETPATADEAVPVKPAFLGAAAQEVPHRQPILEDYVDTDLLDSATKAAANAYSTALSKASEQYSSAVSVVSAQIYGTPKPVHEQLLASVSAAYDFAVAAASTKYDQAVGTPTATAAPAMVDWSKVEEIASQRLNEGRLWAELQYQSAVIALGLATPTPSSASEKYLEQAKRNYFAGLGVAQDRYSSFLNAASSVMSSMTATPTPTNFVGHASSVAAAARESAESIAHLAEEAVESAYSAAGEKAASVASAVDDSIAGVVDGVTEQAYLAGAGIAETWDNALAQISGQVYGEQKHLGWYDGWFDEASSYVSAATEVVADAASGASDKAGDSAVTASAEAAKQYDAVSQLVSELINGKEPTFSESVLSRLSAAYATAAAGVESYASEASAAAASVGEKIGSAASEATEAVKDTIHNDRDEL